MIPPMPQGLQAPSLHPRLKPETAAHTVISGVDTRATIWSCVRKAAEPSCLYNLNPLPSAQAGTQNSSAHCYIRTGHQSKGLLLCKRSCAVPVCLYNLNPLPSAQAGTQNSSAHCYIRTGHQSKGLLLCKREAVQCQFACTSGRRSCACDFTDIHALGRL